MELAELFALDASAVRAASTNCAQQKRDAWMGDAFLKQLLSERIFQAGQTVGEMTRQRQRLESNVMLGVFLTQCTDLVDYSPADSTAPSDHSLGTIFEALLKQAESTKRVEVVRAYADWVEERVDPSLNVTRTAIISLDEGVETETWAWDDEDEIAPDDVSEASTRSDVSTPANVRSALIAMHEAHERRYVHQSKHTYRCPDCRQEFEAWTLCRQHVLEAGHADATNTKGLQQRCMKSRQEAPEARGASWSTS
tara:strand:+ start:241 stop:999 length:759 start_codon:yes stop_codon:yes gene_type:complete